MVVVQLQRTVFLALFFSIICYYKVNSEPNHGYLNFLGYNYWNSRYSADGVNYPSDWSGFWNWYDDGRRNYERSSTYKSHSQCVGCSCNDAKGILECGGVSGTDLHLKNKNIPEINELPVKMERVRIVQSNLKSLGNEIFYNLTNLQLLEITYNPEFKDFPDVSKNSKLTELDLYNNKIKLWRHNCTALPKSLERIILVQNDIDWIPNNWFDLPNLKYLALAHNKLKVFPGLSFINTKQLLYLGVDNNLITTISYPNMEPFFANNSQLIHLNLSHNSIESVASDAFQQLIHLKILEIHVNNIEEISPRVFYKIPELLHLDLGGNKLKTITATGYSSPFEDLPKLKCLILMSQKTGFQTEHVLYNAFKNLRALEDLWLNNNKLNYFPHPALSGQGMPLKFLHLEFNSINSLNSFEITDFPPGFLPIHGDLKTSHKPFEKLSTLERLFVHQNQISKIDEEDLWHLNKLQDLYADLNQLSNATVHPEAFRNLTSLRRLDLGTNQFYNVPLAVTKKSRLPSINHL